MRKKYDLVADVKERTYSQLADGMRNPYRNALKCLCRIIQHISGRHGREYDGISYLAYTIIMHLAFNTINVLLSYESPDNLSERQSLDSYIYKFH